RQLKLPVNKKLAIATSNTLGLGPYRWGTRVRRTRTRLLFALFDAVHGLVVESEIVTDLVHDGFAHEIRHLLFVLAVFFDRSLIDRDRIGQDVAVAGVT